MLHFGGHVELDESIWSALMHEMLEETGYKQEQISVLQPKNHIRKLSGKKAAILTPQPMLINTHDTSSSSKHFHIDIVYALTVSENPIGKIAKNESDLIIEYDLSEISSLVSRGESIPFIEDVVSYAQKQILNKWIEVPAQSYSTQSS